jgi:hypothetical protein
MQTVSTSTAPLPVLTAQEMADLTLAKSLLECPSLTARLAAIIGEPIEKGFKQMPQDWAEKVQEATRIALSKALELAMVTLDRQQPRQASEWFHKVLVGASGGAGGLFGLAALPIELPITTTLMLRSIADIARSEGFDMADLPVRLSCLEVFALGSRRTDGQESASDYWSVRSELEDVMVEASSYLALRGLVKKSAPAVVRLVGAVASRFGAVVAQQMAAKAIPMVSAATGTIINVMLINHFQEMARGHFIVKRLEAKYSFDGIRQIYQSAPVPSSKRKPAVDPAPAEEKEGSAKA